MIRGSRQGLHARLNGVGEFVGGVWIGRDKVVQVVTELLGKVCGVLHVDRERQFILLHGGLGHVQPMRAGDRALERGVCFGEHFAQNEERRWDSEHLRRRHWDRTRQALRRPCRVSAMFSMC